ncbi:MAG: hypothetical protein ACRD3S_02710, partial [Terracidiphilus sp.]
MLLESNAAWNAPGGATAYIDARTGESLLIFHAHSLAHNAMPFQWLTRLDWVNDWPVLAVEAPKISAAAACTIRL